MKKLRKEITTIVLIDQMKRLSKTKKVFGVVAKMLSKPKQQQITVNLNRLNRVTSENQTVIVPGKLLSLGEINHKLTVYAHRVSNAAKEKLTKAGCNVHDMNQLVADQPKNTVLVA